MSGYFLSRTHSFLACLAPFLEGLPVSIAVRKWDRGTTGASVPYRGRYVSPAYDRSSDVSLVG